MVAVMTREEEDGDNRQQWRAKEATASGSQNKEDGQGARWLQQATWGIGDGQTGWSGEQGGGNGDVGEAAMSTVWQYDGEDSDDEQKATGDRKGGGSIGGR